MKKSRLPTTWPEVALGYPLSAATDFTISDGCVPAGVPSVVQIPPLSKNSFPPRTPSGENDESDAIGTVPEAVPSIAHNRKSVGVAAKETMRRLRSEERRVGKECR